MGYSTLPGEVPGAGEFYVSYTIDETMPLDAYERHMEREPTGAERDLDRCEKRLYELRTALRRVRGWLYGQHSRYSIERRDASSSLSIIVGDGERPETCHYRPSDIEAVVSIIEDALPGEVD